MKTSIKIFTGTLLLTLFLIAPSCDKLLEEQPRDMFTPGYFQTEEGVNGGLTALYAHLRDMYGHGYYHGSCVAGTDEYTYGALNNGNPKPHDMSGQGTLSASTSRSDVVWNTVFTYINTASGIIENAAAVNLSNDLVAEARFFRAFDYFLLVQTFGGVPLDLGAGDLAFNSSPARTSKRNTVPEVYTKAVFPDLRTAVANLPEKNLRITDGGVTKTAARLHLAKAYLTYGWWLENPNSIPTYPECPRTDPDGHDAAWYYQEAYKVAVEAINNPGPFGLLEYFYDVNLGSNDRNKEIVLYADHNWTSTKYNEVNVNDATGAAPDNFACWMVAWNYETLRSGSVMSILREISQDLGRPWTALAIPHEVVTNTFADKTNDSRYDGTFVTTYRGNWNKAANAPATVKNANGIDVNPGEALLTFLPDESLAAQIKYPDGSAGESNVAAGVITNRADYVMTPSAISRVISPALWKILPYRTDLNGGLGSRNSGSNRPFPVAKFSELFLIAAEAAVKGNVATPTPISEYSCDGTARGLLNVLRARAGKWRWDHAENKVKEANNSDAMVNATPADIDIDYILAERSRELFGEGYRWYDLVRTQTWERIAASYTICETGADFRHVTPTTIRRTIEKYHYLRPIPQGQLDGMEMNDEEKDLYQNPGYR
jgi:hypothetical protein